MIGFMELMRQILLFLMDYHKETSYRIQLDEVNGVPQPTTDRFVKGKHSEPKDQNIKKWAAHYKISETQFRGLEPLPGNLQEEFEKWRNNDKTPKIEEQAPPALTVEQPLLELFKGDKFWEQIVYCYGGMSDKNKDALAKIANTLYVQDHPDDPIANPAGRRQKGKISFGRVDVPVEGVSVDARSDTDSRVPKPGASRSPGGLAGTGKKR
jgi:hypothetical protein